MEEKLLRLIKAIDAYTQTNKNHYAELNYEGDNKKITISIREKKTFAFKQIIETIMDKESLISIDNIIEKLEKGD